jgi:hypothetical protein
MTKAIRRLNALFAASLSGILVASVFFVGFATTNGPRSAYGAMMDDKGNGSMMSKGDNNMSGNSTMMENNSMMMAGEHRVVKGQISNVQLDSSGKPDWIQSGIWVLRVTFGDNNSVQAAQLVARFAMVKPDGTAMHSHMIYDFKPTEFTTEQNDTVHVLKGTATVTMKDGPVEDVSVTIKVFNAAVIGLWIGPDKADGHFGSNPIYGILSMGSRAMMIDMDSMMGEGKMMGSGNEQNLTKTNIPVILPLTRGYANGHEVFYISTESSDKDLAAHLTNLTGSRVVYAQSLANTPPLALANIYAFKNGIEGTGPLGFQPNVADSEPGQTGYSPLWKIILVQWKDGVTATELKSEQEITAAIGDGRLTIEPTSMVVNCPFVKWEGGSLMTREDKTLTDQSPYGPGQVLEINTEKLQVTFVAHRGFAPDGSTIYYIATDASNPDVAKALGVTFVNKTGAATLSGASSDLWVFTNGIKGTGPMGFQVSIAGSNVGDVQYSPIWRINAATWKDTEHAKFLTTAQEISMAVSNGMLTTEIAGFVVNCPFVEVSAT